MSERQRIEEQLRRKEAEVFVLEERLITARAYLQALRDVLRILSGDEPEEAGPAEAMPRAGSSVAQARDVILARGEPVHVNDLLEAAGRAPSRENRVSLTSSLSAYVRRGDIFTRPAPNTFGLIELGHHAAPGAAGDMPPPKFGPGAAIAAGRED